MLGDRAIPSRTPSEPLTIQLQQAIADLQRVNPWVGLGRFLLLGGVFLVWVFLAWWTTAWPLFLLATVLAGLSYAFWLICTHDMAHQTLTGWGWFDRIMPRLMSWPMFWPYSTYAELHRLHHGWNGSDLRDPERVQWTVTEYEKASPLLRWYIQHQWWIDIFGSGGIGLILKTFRNGFLLRKVAPRLRHQVLLDMAGMAVVHSFFLGVAVLQDQVLRYLIFWFILERMIGMIIQIRDHLEHYGLWEKRGTHTLTQLYTCRNIQTLPGFGWIMGGLNYHAIHHAFPQIPFHELPKAFDRIQGILTDQGLPAMTLDVSYVQSTLHLSQKMVLIDQE